MSDNPATLVGRLAASHYVPRCLHVAAELGVADAVPADGILISDLASEIGVHAQALYRILRILVSEGIFEFRDSAIHHNSCSAILRSDHPSSVRTAVRWMGSRIQWEVFGELEYAVRSGRPAICQRYAGGLFDYLQQNPGPASLFYEFLERVTPHYSRSIARSYDFARFESVCDVGGGSGLLAQEITKVTSTTSVILFDLPRVLVLRSDISCERIELLAGDFFSTELPSCDGYILKNVIHDWPDDDALTILKSVRRSAPPNARVLLVEAIMEDTNTPTSNMTLDMDLGMLVLTGGRERSLREFQCLLEGSSFEFVAVHDTKTNLALIEGVVA